MQAHMSLIRFVLALITVGFSTTTYATDYFWLLLGQTGNKPNRVAYYAFDGWMFDRTDPNVKANEIMRDHNPKTIEARVKALRQVEVEVLQVFESPKSPAFMRMYLMFDCGKRQYYIKEAEAIARNRVPHKSSRAEWQPVPNNWLDRAHFVACEEETWRQAGSDDLTTSRKSGKGAQPKMQALGLGMVGQWTGPSKEPQVESFTWEKIWTDGTRPPFNDDRTAKEEKIYQEHIARNKQTLEENAKAAGQIDSMMAGVEGQLKGMDEESKFQEEIAKNFSKHPNRLYDVHKGLTEEQLVDLRGVPSGSSVNGNLKSIVYAYMQDSRHEVAVRDGNGNVVGMQETGQVLGCEVTFKLRKGGSSPEFRVVDYVAKQDITSQGFGKCK